MPGEGPGQRTYRYAKFIRNVVAAHDEDAAGLARATMKGFVVGLLPMVSAMIGQRLASHVPEAVTKRKAVRGRPSVFWERLKWLGGEEARPYA